MKYLRFLKHYQRLSRVYTAATFALLLFSVAPAGADSPDQNPLPQGISSRITPTKQVFSTKLTISTKLGQCRSLADNLERLGCFDQLADSVASDTDAGDSARATNFGQQDAIVREDSEQSVANPVMSGKIAVVRADIAGKLILQLENKQVWVQTDSGKINLHPGDMVTISKSGFAGYSLRKATGNLSIRVRRKNQSVDAR